MTDLATPPRFLADIHDAASECNKCSLCQATCPTYVTNPVEWETARGRVSLIRDAIEGRLELRDIEDGPLSTCLTCDCCVVACPPAVPTAMIVSRARQELHEQEGHPRGQTVALRTIFARPTWMRIVHGLSRAAQVTGLHGLARRTGITGWLGVAGSLAEHVGPLPKRTAHRRARALPQAQPPVRARLGFLVCCYQNIAVPEATEATMRVLLANGYELVVPALGCSGLPARTMGDRSAELDMAVRTVERLSELDVDGFVGDVASCTGQWRRHGELLAEDRLLADKARQIASRTWLASAFLSEVGVRSELGPLRWRVAYDEPCSLPQNTADRSAARQLLEAIPHLTLVDLEEAAMCCGGPGTYFHSQPERSEAILARKFDHVVATGANVLVTENVSCITQLRAGARRYAPHVRVMHLFEVLEASLESHRRRAPLDVDAGQAQGSA
ncbi:MAG: (Fe-S)-binding protein [Candidatus Dormibacteria bacterium]